jgi:alkanesulfonate monooxygenase SsuD/methylene tetrahydromethanopterin reductase-like flavin-dependent oxidoreductase (luciferase family)
VAEEAAMLDNLTDGRLDMGLGRGLRPPEFAAFGVDQQRSREMFLESFDIISRVWADENFIFRGKYWTVRKGRTAIAAAGAAAAPAIPGQCTERRIAAVGSPTRYPIRTDRLDDRPGKA